VRCQQLCRTRWASNVRQGEGRESLGWRKWMLVSAVTICGGIAAGVAGAPVAWMVGPLVGAMALALGSGKALALPSWPQALAQVILGVSVGGSFPAQTLGVLMRNGVALLCVLVTTAAMSLAMAYVLWRLARVEQGPALLGSLPGAAATMVAISGSMGLDARVVAVLQYLRVLTILFFAPLFASRLLPTMGLEAGTTAVSLAGEAMRPGFVLARTAAMMAAGLVGACAGRRLRLPAGLFLGPFLVALLVTWAGLLPTAPLPQPLLNLALALIGASVGVRFDVAVLSQLRRAAWLEPLLVVAMVAASAPVGVLFHAMTGVDSVTATLGAIPGGMEGMIATSIELEADTAMVTAMHMLRFLVVLLLGPWAARQLGRSFPGLERRENLDAGETSQGEVARAQGHFG
jgi:membrane AbrB-like protein